MMATELVLRHVVLRQFTDAAQPHQIAELGTAWRALLTSVPWPISKGPGNQHVGLIYALPLRHLAHGGGWRGLYHGIP